MGDQLAKGWADSSAKPQVHLHSAMGDPGCPICKMFAERTERIFAARETHAEIQAEEDMLP